MFSSLSKRQYHRQLKIETMPKKKEKKRERKTLKEYHQRARSDKETGVECCTFIVHGEWIVFPRTISALGKFSF